MSILLRGKKSLSQLARAILKSFGSNASSYPFSTRQGAYQTSAGPAAIAVNDPIGLELDAMGTTVGPELVTNGDFSAGTTGWTDGTTATPTVADGVLTITNTGSGVTGCGRGFATVVGQTYVVNVDWTQVSATTAYTGIDSTNLAWGTLLLDLTTLGQGKRQAIFKATSTTTYVSLLQNATAGQSTKFDNISVREITGIPAVQPTAINRPTLQQDGNGRFYASFNGTNQSMALSSVPFQMADDFCITTCINPGVQAGNGAIFAVVGAGAVARIELYVAVTTGFAAFYLHDDATGISAASGATDIRNSPCVVTLWKVGNAKYLRVNSVQVATDSTVLGTATFTDAAWGCLPVVFADYFNGGNYEGDAIKGTLTLAQVITLEKAAAQKAGLVL